MIVQNDIIFDTPGGVPLTFDYIRPETDMPLPLVIFIHGGGWISGDKSHFREEAEWLAQLGFACACTSYRLAPLHPFPAAVQDVQNFVRFVRASADDLFIDLDHIAAIGSSAGGHLAAMLGLCDEYITVEDHPEWDDISPKVTAVVDVCGLTDLTDPVEKHFPIAWGFIEQFMGCSYEGNEAVWKKASPLFHVSSTDASFLIAHGNADDVVPFEQSVELDKALREAGVSCEFLLVADEGHGFSWPIWAQFREEYVRFLKATLGFRAKV